MEFNESEAKFESNLETLLRKLLLCLKICGAYIERGVQEKFRCNVNVTFHVWILVLVWIDNLRFIAILIEKNDVREVMSIGVLIALVYPMSFFIVCCFVQFPTKIPEMCRKFVTYQNKYGLKINIAKWTKIVNYLAIFFTLTTLLAIPLFVYLFRTGAFSEKSVFSNLIFYFKFSDNEYFQLFTMILAVLKGLFLSYFYCSYYFMFFLMCRILILEYRGLNKELKDFIETYNDGKCYLEELESIESFWKQHVAITALTNTTNDVIRHMAGMQYGVTLPMICLTLYGIVYDRIEVEDLIFFAEYIIVFSLLMIHLTLTGASLNKEAHAPLDMINSLNLKEAPLKAIMQVQYFASRLNGHPIGINLYGMFVIDRSTILMLMGTLLTYAVVVLQMAPHDDLMPSIANEIPGNSSCICANVSIH